MGSPIPQVTTFRDLGVLIDSKLTFTHHISKIVRSASFKAFSSNNSFLTRSIPFRRRLLCSYIRPSVEYATSVWHPRFQCQMLLLESPLRRFTKFTAQLSDTPYPSRLLRFNITSLCFRRIISDLVLAFKVITGYFLHVNTDAFFTLHESTRTRASNRYRLRKPLCRTDLRAHFWSIRIIDLWNKLPAAAFDSKCPKAFKTYISLHCRELILQFLHMQYPNLQILDELSA